MLASLTSHGRVSLTTGTRSAALINTTRGLAQVASTPIAPAHRPTAAPLEPFLLEDISQGKSEEEIKKIPQFTLSRAHGFLPRQIPLVDLPKEFSTIDSLLKRMTIKQYDAQGKEVGPGLLALGQFGDAVKHELKLEDVTGAIDKIIASGDQRLLSALFRDYCFATSAYLLEPTDQSFRATGLYAPGRDRLPPQLAVPIKKLADALGHQPFMEYASSYALVNYKFKDPQYTGGEAGRYSFDNLDLIRSFEDPLGSEKGFIAVHIVMVSFSGQALTHTESALAAVQNKDVVAFEEAMSRLLSTYKSIQVAMETMWSRSKPSDYLKFRSFIFGTAPKKDNPMFPNGVIYEGVSEEAMNYRGESGANDSLVPILDNLLEVTAALPDNDLTRTLRDFRSYRPRTQREYLTSLEARATAFGVKEFALGPNGSSKAKALYVLMVDQIREFRNRHWMFAKSYILQQTTFQYATGGSKMLSYLPHNLGVVLSFLDESYASFSSQDAATLQAKGEHELLEEVHAAGKRAATQHRILLREVDTLRKDTEEKEKREQLEEGTRLGGRGTLGEPRRPKRGMVGCDGVG